MRASASRPAAPETLAILTVPSFSMSIVVPVSSVICADDRATLADDVADLLRVDLHA